MDTNGTVKELIVAVERLLLHLDHHVPTEIVHVDEIRKLIDQLKDDAHE